jgi:Protein of unknown function (DUF2721)
MTTEMIVRTISLILAPVVMITSCVLLLNGLLTRYEIISARMRAMHRERLDLLQVIGYKTSDGEPTLGFSMQRVQEIETQLPPLLYRHKLIRNAILAVNVAILIFISSMFIIALAVITNTPLTAGTALLAFLIGTGALLVGIVITTLELYRSQREVAYEIRHGLSLRKEDLLQQDRT